MKSKALTIWSLVWLLATVLLVVGGALNLSQRANHPLPPTDGIVWVQKPNGIFAEKVAPDSAGGRAQIIKGDRLIAISLDGKTFDEISSPAEVPMYLETAGIDGNLTYFYQRTSYSSPNYFYYADLSHLGSAPRWTSSIIFLTFVGLIWLIVGGFVLFKQGGHAPFVLHFATVCLAAFVFHVYKPLGLGKDFDLAVSLLDDAAFAFFVPLFLHFCLRYPVRSEVFDNPRWKTYALYVPAAIITLGIFILSLTFPIFDALSPNSVLMANFAEITDKYDLFALFYQANFYHFVIGVSLGASVLLWRFFTNRQPVVRQRLKWAVWGTVAAVVPVLGFQIAKLFFYLPEDSFVSAFTTLPLALIPLSFGHSVVRYRLMDVDVVVRRALVYALTTVAIAAMIGAVALGLVFLAIGTNLSTTEITLRALIAIIAMAAIVLLSEPLKNLWQERADRLFYGERYDLRRGLLDFGITLSATTALEPLLNALVGRLQQVLDVEKVAVFIEDEKVSGGYRLAKSVAVNSNYAVPNDFRQMIREKSAGKGIIRADELELLDIETSDGKSIVRQELHYYVPCVVRGKMVAVIGLGRAADGSLLSSEDLDILQTVAGYVAVAIENSLLYQEQEKRAGELALLKEFNESIVESVNVGLLAVDESGRVTRCNSQFEEMFGLKREQTAGKLVEEIFEENFAANLSQILGKSRWHLQELRHGYKLYTTGADGKILILNVAVAPLRSVIHEQNGAIIVLENVTSRVKLEQSLQQSEKLSSIGLLAAGVAHEVNTPLTGVSSYTQMLLGMIPETDPKHALLLKVQRQTERASNIAGNLLNFSRTGNGAAEFHEINVNKTLDDALQLLEPQLRKSRVEIVKNYESAMPKIYANAGKMQQIFTNLILNARDAIFDGGTITLTTKIGGDDAVIIEIADNGTGIAPENLSKIYDPFFTTKGVGSGTGLGLAVTYGIVQEHSGTIQATSEPGEGTTFRLEFPAVREQLQEQLQRAVG
ncbi:MAG: ATP-binding protein [Pyrinomonadaceae bacterium]